MSGKLPRTRTNGPKTWTRAFGEPWGNLLMQFYSSRPNRLRVPTDVLQHQRLAMSPRAFCPRSPRRVPLVVLYQPQLLRQHTPLLISLVNPV